MGKNFNSCYLLMNINYSSLIKGTLTENGQQPNVLYNVQINSYPASFCSNYNNFDSNSQICAGINSYFLDIF